MHVQEIAPGVVAFTSRIVNSYGLEGPEGPVLVDGGLAFNAAALAAAFETRFGGGAKAIYLTHGHPDHAGGVRAMAEKWGCRVYVHPMERPYLVGRSRYPDPDVTLGGPVALVARFFRTPMINLTGLLEPLPEDGSVPFAPGWQWIAAPGHSPGHVAFWNVEHGVLLGGDAVATEDYESWEGFIKSAVLRQPKISVAGGAFVCDWQQEIHSIRVLADLRPKALAPGHGPVLINGSTAEKMAQFAATTHAPANGRYTGSPAKVDETGLISVPAAEKDDLPKKVALLGGSFALLAVLFGATRRRKPRA